MGIAPGLFVKKDGVKYQSANSEDEEHRLTDSIGPGPGIDEALYGNRAFSTTEQ